MVTAVDAVTTLVLTVKVALVAPAGTVTLEGTVTAAVLLLESATCAPPAGAAPLNVTVPVEQSRDRKSTRLNSSHGYISYAVFCLKKKKYNHDDISSDVVELT